MQWLLSAAYQVFYVVITDYVVFTLVDCVAKAFLKDAKCEADKRVIWLYESLALAGVCIPIYLLDHTPYICFGCFIITILYTQFILGRLGYKCSNWSRKLFEKWEEHQHHSENVQLINEKQKQMELLRKIWMPPQANKSFFKRVFDFIRRRSDKQPMFVPMNMVPAPGQPQPPHHGNIGQRPVVTSVPNVEPSQKVEISSHLPVRQYPSRPPASSSPSQIHTATQPTPQYTPVNNWITKPDLKRRPLSTYNQRHESQSSFSATRTNLKQRVLSAFGYNDRHDKPAGIRNEGQNLCFLNSVLQCLSHSPSLVDKLDHVSSQELDCSEAKSTMINTLTELVTQCRRTKNEGALNPVAFREAVAALNCGLVSSVSERQQQQDAAEFFMWLMELLHTALNKKSTQEKRVEKGSLEMLKFIYGDLNTEAIEKLKVVCRQEIEAANGLRNESYAEPIQRLSDLEWLTYKRANHSVVDELFTGQLVEAYHCLTDNHITVNTQTFNILPVPVVTPTTVSGLVHLEECFTKFCKSEHLVGQEGLQCSQCNKNANNVGLNNQTPVIENPSNQRTTRSSAKASHSTTQGTVDSAYHSTMLSPSAYMSPIPRTEVMNNSGLNDAVFRTSTPVTGETPRFIFPSRHIREAERRSLLRQLPQCLVVQLLRFSYNHYTRQCRKTCSPVSIPLKGLDLTSIVYDNVTNRDDMSVDQKVQTYDLYGIVVHLGAESTNYGHYICYCLAENGRWYKFDDELVWDVNIEYEMTTREIRENAYMLFYKRTKAST